MQNTILTDDDKKLITWVKHHPTAAVAYFSNKQISDAGAEALVQERTSLVANVCRDFWQQLDGGDRVVRGASLRLIQEFVMTPDLTMVYLSDTLIGNAGLVALANGCRNLKLIRLDNTQISDDGAVVLSNKCKHLRDALLNNTQVGNDGVVALANNCPKLSWVGLHNCSQVNDDGIAELGKKCKQLRHVFVNRTQVSESGAQALADACPKACVYL